MPETAARKKILVVEDDTLLSELLTTKLAERYIIQYAPTGEVALKRVAEEKPDLVVLDISLPGMDGFEVLQHIKADPKTADVRVVILSNVVEDEDVEKGKKLGAEEYIVKVSLTLDEVVNLVQSIIERTKITS
jgi:DNA-binding response OmpR family regulator